MDTNFTWCKGKVAGTTEGFETANPGENPIPTQSSGRFVKKSNKFPIRRKNRGGKTERSMEAYEFRSLRNSKSHKIRVY